MRRPMPFERLDWKIGVAVSLLVLGGLSIGFYVLYVNYRDEALTMSRTHAATAARLMRLALEHQMLESKDRSLVKRMVDSFAVDPPIERVMVLDREGKVRFSSDPTVHEQYFNEKDATCTVCHSRPPDFRQRAVVIDLAGHAALRSVQPIPNRPACHECHDPEDTMNGLLIVDVEVGSTIKNVKRSVRRLALGTAATALLLIFAIILVFRRFLLARLYRFESTARAISLGDLERRVPVEGNDALTRLERQFNRMADSVVELLERVQDQRASLQRIIDSVDDGLVVLSPDLYITAANQAFARRFGTTADALIGQCCWQTDMARSVGCGPGTDHECPALMCLSGGAVSTAVLTVPGVAGARRYEEVRASPLRDEDGVMSHVVEVWRDISDRRSAEARLADYQRMASVGMLASGFSHEINTPLASISACLDAVESVCRDMESQPPQAAVDVREYVAIASREVVRCGAITQQFLQLVRGRSLRHEILDLGAVASLVAGLVAPTAREAGVRIEVEPADVPVVLAPPSSVQQVLLNLLLNAVQASEPATVVRVCFAVDTEARRVEVQVRDQGCGLPTDEPERIFEPFFSKREGGTGLGLFVSLNLARGWGGDLQVVDTGAAGGTTFALHFALAHEGEA